MVQNNKDFSLMDENPNKPLTEAEKKSRKKKQIIGICIVSILLAIAIVLTVLAFTIFFKK